VFYRGLRGISARLR